MPHLYDQPYLAGRVRALGIGTAHPDGEPTAGSLTAALEQVLRPGVASRARSFAPRVRTGGAQIAARHVS